MNEEHALSEIDNLDPIDVRMGAKLTQIRQERGCRQRDVAQVLGVSRSHLSNIESGRSKPGWRHLLGLSNHYGVDVRALMREASGINTHHNPNEASDAASDGNASQMLSALDQMCLCALRMLPREEQVRVVEELVHRALHRT